MSRLNLRRLVDIGALVAGVLLCGLPAVSRAADTDVIDVPMFYLVLKGADLNVPQGKTVQSELEKFTKLINNIFERNDANINFVTVNDGIRLNREPPGGGGTSKLDATQRNTLLKNGAAYLKEDQGDKGMLIVLAQQTNKDQPSWLGACFQGEPVGIVTAGNVQGIDTTAAHEIGHSLTLGHYMPAVPDKDNLMAETNSIDSSKLVASQITALRKAALVRGKVKMKAMPDKPAENKPQALGIAYDPDQLLATAPSFQNIFSASLGGFGDEAAYDVRLDLAGLVPSAGAAASYRMLFDVDARADTGAMVDGRPGIDQILRVDLNDAGVPSYALQNAVTLSTVPLAGAMTRRLEFGDTDGSQPGIAEPHHDDFEIVLPKSLLQLSGSRFLNIPVLASANGATTDLFNLDLDRQYELDGPQLAADVGLVGPLTHTVKLSGSNFAADSLVDLYAGGTFLTTVSADADGVFLATIDLPADVLQGSLLYLHAFEQSTTDYGFTVVNVVPEPGAAYLTLVSAALMGAWVGAKKTRRQRLRRYPRTA